MSGADDQIQDAISDALEQLTGDAVFRLAGLTAHSVTIFEVSRDEHGTPEAMMWNYSFNGGELHTDTGAPDLWSQAVSDPGAFHARVAPRLIVRDPRTLPSVVSDLLPSQSRVPVHRSMVPLRDLLHAARRASPLRYGYELALLRPVPPAPGGAAPDGRTKLVLTGLPLFSPGEIHGCEVQFQVRIEPAGAEGTFFVVGTREQRPEVPRLQRRLRPFQRQAAVLPPGTYDVTATLVRPGQVRFEGLPVPLADTDRSWENLQRLAPSHLLPRQPAHLVCLIETCGGDDLLSKRTHWLEELVTRARGSATPLRVSVVSYGAHGVAWKVPDRGPRIETWLAPPDRALHALRGLTGRRADEREYPRAAQLECALQKVRERLRPADGRPVIVTAGERPPHPHKLDTETQLITCPGFVSAASELARLRRLPGIRFGALRARRPPGPAWAQLSQHALATIDDVVDIESFAAALGLIATTQQVPFPLTIPSRATGRREA